jgi:hypothetical protein
MLKTWLTLTEKIQKITTVTVWISLWELMGSNHRPSACKADALNQLS